jgi:dTMP kinase
MSFELKDSKEYRGRNLKESIILKHKLSGKFIVLDGPDGCGKTTQTRLLAEWLKSQNVPAVTFRDPGDTAIGEKIREILLSTEHSVMDTRTELLLYMAARAQLWAEKMAPALKENKCVILDRWLCSTCTYQGYAGGFGMEKVIKIATDCLERVWPDMTIILDVDIKTAIQRLNRQLDRMEQKGSTYHEKVREGFLQLAKQRKDFRIVDGGDTIENIHKKIIEEVMRFF